MTAKEKKAASARMKAIWAKRKAIQQVVALPPAERTNELHTMDQIIKMMETLSAAGKQYLVNRFM